MKYHIKEAKMMLMEIRRTENLVVGLILPEGVFDEEESLYKVEFRSSGEVRIREVAEKLDNMMEDGSLLLTNVPHFLAIMTCIQKVQQRNFPSLCIDSEEK